MKYYLFTHYYSHAGISRSSTVLIAYLLKYKKMKLDAAMELAKSKRAKINPNVGKCIKVYFYILRIFKTIKRI